MNDKIKTHRSKSSIILYHYNCPDGIFAAELIQKNFLFQYTPCKLIALQPRFILNQFLRALLLGKQVFVVDLATDIEVMKEVCYYAESVFYIDHHELTWTPESFEQKNLYYYYNKENSASHLTMEFLSKHEIELSKSAIKCIELINKLDLHKPLTESENHLLEGWMSICRDNRQILNPSILEDCFSFDELTNTVKFNRFGRYVQFEGKQFLEKRNNLYTELCNNIKVIEIESHKTAVIEYYEKNDLANFILEKFPNIEIAIVWGISGKRITSSWRSRTINLIPIVSKYGGGGHMNACGLLLNNQLLKTLGFT